MAETRETKRVGGARTRAMPMKRKKERVATCVILENASLTGHGRKDVSIVFFQSGDHGDKVNLLTVVLTLYRERRSMAHT